MTEFDINCVTREKVLEMVKDEQVVRYSKNIQEIYTEQYYASSSNPNYKLVNIEREIQKHILRKYGFTDDETSLSGYWKIPSTYWNDEEVKNSLFYMKYNIFKYPSVKVGDQMIDIELLDYKTDENILLSSLQRTDRPLVILAGSMT